MHWSWTSGANDHRHIEVVTVPVADGAVVARVADQPVGNELRGDLLDHVRGRAGPPRSGASIAHVLVSRGARPSGRVWRILVSVSFVG